MSSDNPFDESESDKTILRPSPGGRRPAAAPAAAMEATRVGPAMPLPPAAATVAEGTENLRIGDGPLLAAATPLLQLLARLRNTLNQPDALDLRERAVAEMRRFETRARDGGVPMEQLRPAHYALCAALDDVVLATPWGSQGGWDTRSLVSTFHQEVRSGERFFDNLNKLKQSPGTFLPVLELAYLCLALGYQGRYRISARGQSELEKLREDLYTIIARQRAEAAVELSPHWMGATAPYRPSRASVPVWVVGVAALAVIAGLFAWFSQGLNAASDDLFARMQRVPPPHMPQLVRAVAVPPPPPAPPEPGVLQTFRTFLKPEIDQGLVTVLGTDAVPIVRIRNRGMFPSGSATVQPQFISLLERIGTALKTEPGSVQVIGHTDNQPIRTVQFPSNFQLSAARAQAARAVIARTVDDASRLVAEGRADSEPIGNNATPEGRDENRRIEVVLRRRT